MRGLRGTVYLKGNLAASVAHGPSVGVLLEVTVMLIAYVGELGYVGEWEDAADRAVTWRCDFLARWS
jgi:hypothetical protein